MTEREKTLAAKVEELEEKLTKAHRLLNKYESKDDDLWLDFIKKVSKSQSKFGSEARKLLDAV